MIGKVKLKDYSIDMDDEHGLVLCLIYSYESKDGIHELHLPMIRLGIYGNEIPSIDVDNLHLMFYDQDVVANFGTNRFPLIKTDFVVPDKFGDTHLIDAHYADCLVKENVVEMTLDDIEKKLGHKIKIVNKEG